MALQKTVKYKDIEIKNAYIKVAGFSGDKNRLQAVVTIQAAPEKQVIDTTQFTVPYVLDGENPIKQAYEYIKTLPEYENAVDC